VTNAIKAATGENVKMMANMLVTVYAMDFDDPGILASADGQQAVYRWDFGDGSNDTAARVVLNHGVTTAVEVLHVYRSSGRYTVAVAVVVNDDVISESSVNVTVFDPVEGLIIGHSAPTLVNKLTFVEARVEAGTDVSFTFYTKNTTMTDWSVFNVTDEAGITNGARLMFSFKNVGDYVISVIAINAVSSSSTSVVIHVVDDSTLRIMGLTTYAGGLQLCGLAPNVDVPLSAAVIHWNVSRLLFLWSSSSLSLSSFTTKTNVTFDWNRFGNIQSGFGLRQVVVRFKGPGVYHLALHVADIRRQLYRSYVYQICANNTFSGDMSSSSTWLKNITRMNISSTWPSHPFVPVDQPLIFFPLLPATNESLSASVVNFASYNFEWSSNASEHRTAGVSIAGRTASFTFRRPGTFKVTAKQLFPEMPTSIASWSLWTTVVVEPVIERVSIRFASSYLFESVIAVGQSARFIATTLPMSSHTYSLMFTWTFARFESQSSIQSSLATAASDASSSPDDSVVTNSSSIERSFDEAGNWTVTVMAANRATTAWSAVRASTSVEVQYPITNLSIIGCCSTPVQTGVEVTFGASVVTGSGVSYTWQLRRVVDAVDGQSSAQASFREQTVVGPVLVHTFRDAGVYRVGLSAENKISSRTAVDELLVQVRNHCDLSFVQTCNFNSEGASHYSRDVHPCL
jgi:hypothetical protein